MVSSLPFLTPVFHRRAREYRSKFSGYGSEGGSRHHRGRGGQIYKLTALGRVEDPSSGTLGKGASTSAYITAGADNTEHSASGSQEDILKRDGDIVNHPSNVIVKSVTYSVRVDDETARDTKESG